VGFIIYAGAAKQRGKGFKMMAQIHFSIKEKNAYIKRMQKVYGGKKVKAFSYVYPKDSGIIYRDQDFIYQIATLTGSGKIRTDLTQKQIIEINKRAERWFDNHPRHKALVLSWTYGK